MDKFAVVLLLLLLFVSPSYAAFHNMFVNSDQRDIGYYYFAGLTGAAASSGINYDMPVDENRAIELSMWGSNTMIVYSSTSNTVFNALLKQKLWNWGELHLSGVLGAGMFYNSKNAGFSLCPNVGVLVGYRFSDSIKVSLPVIVNGFKDGAAVDYSFGLAAEPPFWPGKEIVAGIKGIMMGYSSGGNSGAFSNTNYGMVGLRAYF